MTNQDKKTSNDPGNMFIIRLGYTFAINDETVRITIHLARLARLVSPPASVPSSLARVVR